jgi:exoribonuclease-2
MPGWKLTMLPDALVRAYTLSEGQACAAISLYARFDEASLEPMGFETRIERVQVASNLRHDLLDEQISEASLCGEAPASYPHATELAFAFRLARALKSRRELVRGKPEVFNRPDYNFRLEREVDGEPDGTERVQIAPRRRGAPLDLIVSEAMILANSHWGGWLAEHNVPAIYRSQSSRHRRQPVQLGDLATAALCGSGEPMADRGLRAPRTNRCAGCTVQAPRRHLVLDHFVLRRDLQRVQRLPTEHRAILDLTLASAARSR